MEGQGKFPDSEFSWDEPKAPQPSSQQGDKKGDYQLKTEHGYMLDECISALTKEVRRGNEDKALFWAFEICLGGYAKYFFRRMSVLVAEEIGLADPFAVVHLNAVAQCYERRTDSWSKGPHTTELIGQLILYLCRAPKSHEAAMAAYAVEEEMNAGRRDEVPEYARDMHTRAGRDLIKQKGMSKQDAAVWFHKVLWKLTGVKPGNRWIRRLMYSERDLADTEVKEEVIREVMADYQETEEGQL